MKTTAKPIVASTSLSVLLHGLAFAGLVLVYGQTLLQDEGTGRSMGRDIAIQLVTGQQEADVPHRQQTPTGAVSEKKEYEEKREPAEPGLAVDGGERRTAVAENGIAEPDVSAAVAAEDPQPSVSEQPQPPAEHREASVYSARASNDSRQQHTILQLLHSRISENKEYPYLARRQRREGIATVAFVLHPDGRIENPHLVTSSRAASLDRAALSAVKHIEPFAVAREYLQRPEQFQVDIEFDLL